MSRIMKNAKGSLLSFGIFQLQRLIYGLEPWSIGHSAWCPKGNSEGSGFI